MEACIIAMIFLLIMDLSLTCHGVAFPNPLVLASGILGVTGNSLKHVAEKGAGGVTTKSIWLSEHKGHPNPVMIANEHYMLNAVGVPDAGIEKAREELATYLACGAKAPLIANIIAGRVDDYGDVAERVAELNPHFIEVNISCPNVEDELGRPFACDRDQAARVTSEVKRRTGGKIPIFVKLSPNVESVVDIALRVEAAGADGLTVINTLGPGMAIDVETAQPILANRVGGISGPAIKPLAVKLVYDVYKAVKIPIIGTGGVTTGLDAIEIMMAGATLVGVGTAVYYRGVDVFALIANEMKEWGAAHGISKVEELIGRAHNS